MLVKASECIIEENPGQEKKYKKTKKKRSGFNAIEAPLLM